jgi:aquaporin TIP
MDKLFSKNEFLSADALRAATAEFIATLLFVFLGAGSVVANMTMTPGDVDPTVAISLAHGLAVTILIFATLNVSGGHINPTVTFAAVLTRRMSVTRGFMYVAAQLAGAVLGALLLKVAVPSGAEGNLGAHMLGTGVIVGMGVVMEVVLSFVLVFVVLLTTSEKRGIGDLAPLAIGFAVLVNHLVGVPFTGPSMNPARSFGPALVAGAWANHWVYWVGPLLGGAAAGVLHKSVFDMHPSIMRRDDTEQGGS